jgi:hypothetical protein
LVNLSVHLVHFNVSVLSINVSTDIHSLSVLIDKVVSLISEHLPPSGVD